MYYTKIPALFVRIIKEHAHAALTAQRKILKENEERLKSGEIKNKKKKNGGK